MDFGIPGYARSELHILTGLELRTLDYWAASGILRASAGGQGKGRHRRFEPQEATLAIVLARWSNHGATQKALAAVAAKFHDALDWLDSAGLAGHEIAAANLVGHRREIDATGYSPVPESGLIHFLGRDGLEGMPLIDAADPLGDPRRGLSWAQVPDYVRRQIGDFPAAIVEKCETLDLTEWDRFGNYGIALSHAPLSNAYIEYLIFERDADQPWTVRFREPRDPDPLASDACFLINVARLKRQLWGRS